MQRIGFTLVFVTLVSGLAYFVLTHPSIQKRKKLKREVEQLETKNQKIRHENRQLKRQILALERNSKYREQKARQLSGLVRPGELVLHFDDSESGPGPTVEVNVADKAIRVAGESVAIDRLGEKLVRLHRDLRAPKLKVTFSAEVDPIRKQRVRDLLENSPHDTVVYKEPRP